MKKVTIEFLYETIDGKNDDYYRQKAFDEIYNSDDTLNVSDADVSEVEP